MNTKGDISSLYLSDSSTSDLSYLLNPAVRFVWIVDHMPVEMQSWHQSTVQVNEFDTLQNVKVRGNVFELLLETGKLLEMLPSFYEHGICMLQMENEVPGTLLYRDMGDIPDYLFKNGFYSRFYLPHKNEVGKFECVDGEWMEKVAANKAIKQRIL